MMYLPRDNKSDIQLEVVFPLSFVHIVKNYLLSAGAHYVLPQNSLPFLARTLQVDYLSGV